MFLSMLINNIEMKKKTKIFEGGRGPPKLKKMKIFENFIFFSIFLVILKFEILFINILHISAIFMMFSRIVKALLIT